MQTFTDDLRIQREERPGQVPGLCSIRSRHDP